MLLTWQNEPLKKMIFNSINGLLGDVGKLQKRLVTNTERTSFFLGQKGLRGGFGGIVKGKSQTTRDITLIISFFKIGNETFTEVVVPKLAMYEVLRRGDLIGVVLSRNGKELLAINNFTANIKLEFGYINNWENILFLSGIAITIYGINFSDSRILFTILGLIFLWAGIRLRTQSRLNWVQALNNIGWN